MPYLLRILILSSLEIYCRLLKVSNYHHSEVSVL